MLFSFVVRCSGSKHQERFDAIDILHYKFDLQLSDTTDEIAGVAEIEIRFKKALTSFKLDFVKKNSDGKGMSVYLAQENQNPITYTHDGKQLILDIGLSKPDEIRTYKIKYKGIPEDGLIISKNKYGDRTFFGDNWPDRGKNWLPIVDHPSDKATVEFIVDAPSHYGIVANGSKVGEVWGEERITSHWEMNVPLSTKLMVIGVSPFEVEYLESESGIEVSSWVYPQNREAGFNDFSVALSPLDFFENYIAPFPYSKLANVQSKTRYGGMENASCIFYHERTVNGKRNMETLFAHEISHQWYGDAISELNWHHIWISEGFATYLADLYLEHAYGREALVISLKDERAQVLEFAKRRLAPIVDTTLAVSVDLLNKNSYEKAAWVLHMLRRELGDELFQCCVRTFYNDFKFDNALTENFLDVVEYLSGREFDEFFRQWFHTAGHPVLSVDWTQGNSEPSRCEALLSPRFSSHHLSSGS